MWDTVKIMLSSLGGTLGLILIDTFSLCMALRLFMEQSTQVEPDIKTMYLAVFFTIVATLTTLKLLSGGHSNGLYDYAKQNGFDDDLDSDEDEEEEIEEPKKVKSVSDLSSSGSLDNIEFLEDEVDNENSKEVNKESNSFFDIKIDFDDDSSTLKKFGSGNKSSQRASLDLEDEEDNG